MMNTKKKSVLGLLLLCCLLTFASLGVSAKKERSAAAMPVGKTQVISGYTVKSGNRKVLDVQKSGKKKYKVIPKKAGEATLSYYKGKTLKKKVSVLVYSKNTFRYDTSRLTLKQGSSRTCKAAAYKKCSVKYDTSDKKVATVSAGGRIKGVKKGTATISAKIFYKGQLVKTFRKKVTVTSGSSSGNGGKNETASKKPTCVKKATVYLDQFSDGDGYGALLDTDSSIYIKNLKSNAKITNIKWNKKTINYVYNGLELPYPFKGILINAAATVKPGDTGKVSFDVQQGGKTYSLSCKVTFQERPEDLKPFAKLSVEGEDYTERYSLISPVIFELDGRKEVKIEVEMKPGVKLEEIYILRDTGTIDRPKMQKITIQNGQTAQVKNGDEVIIQYQNPEKPKNYSPCLTEGKEHTYLSRSVSVFLE